MNTVTHKRGFESWRKLCKEKESTTGTSLHEYSNLLEYDFGNHGWSQEEIAEVGRGLQDQSGRICEFIIEEITQLFEWH